MKDRRTVSVIIPVYNTAAWMLEQCFESVLQQTYSLNQIIVVDDGSTLQESADTIQKYVIEHPDCFCFIKNEHGGIAKARNTGIMKVQSDYFCFLDSDDFWKEDFIQKLTEPLSECDYDVVFCGYSRADNSGKKIIGCEPASDQLDDEHVYPYFTPGCGFRIFNTEYIRRINCLFPLGCIMEDEAFNNLSIIHASNITSVQSYGYCIRERTDSFCRDRAAINRCKREQIPYRQFKKCLSLVCYDMKYVYQVTEYKIAKSIMSVVNNQSHHRIIDCIPYSCYKK